MSMIGVRDATGADALTTTTVDKRRGFVAFFPTRAGPGVATRKTVGATPEIQDRR